MRVLVTGKGKAGSWVVRGEQLGKAIGADVTQTPQETYDVSVLVKKAHPDILKKLTGKIVYDVIDSWPQPLGNQWGRSRTIDWLGAQINAVKPAGIVAATKRMAIDCQAFGIPVLALEHHARPRLRKNPIRKEVRTVGYEGSELYLGQWRKVLESACKAKGWEFVVNPAELAELDIVVALRDCSGYAARHYKSNIKLANAQGSGTPVICNRESGYLETASGAEHWADSKEELLRSLDALADYETRLELSAELYQAAPKLENVAAKYKAWLRQNFYTHDSLR